MNYSMQLADIARRTRSKADAETLKTIAEHVARIENLESFGETLAKLTGASSIVASHLERTASLLGKKDESCAVPERSYVMSLERLVAACRSTSELEELPVRISVALATLAEPGPCLQDRYVAGLEKLAEACRSTIGCGDLPHACDIAVRLEAVDALVGPVSP